MRACLQNPLTPALSPSEGERENRSQSQRVCESDDCQMAVEEVETADSFSLSPSEGERVRVGGNRTTQR